MSIASASYLQQLLEANRASMARAVYNRSLVMDEEQQQRLWTAQSIRVATLRRNEFNDAGSNQQQKSSTSSSGGVEQVAQSSALIVASSHNNKRLREETSLPSSSPSLTATAKQQQQQQAVAAKGALVTVSTEELAERMRRQTMGGDYDASSASRSAVASQPRWKMSKVLVGHQGWVQCVAVDPSNQWIASGSSDSMIKIWDLSSGQLKLNLTGHKEGVRGLAICPKTPYMYSCSDDHSVLCWDLERNETIRDFYGHKGAVHCVTKHPSLDLIMTGGRDKVVRVWDIRTRAAVHVLQGHSDTVVSLASQDTKPQLVSGGNDAMIHLWDIGAGKALTRLTRHKKPVRGLALHHAELALVSCGADNIRKWKLPEGEFLTNVNVNTVPNPPAPGAIWTCCAVSHRDTLCIGGSDGQLLFADWGSHSLFQRTKTKSFRGTVEGEGGILCCAFDVSGTRLMTGEGDKSVKIWQQQQAEE